MSEASFTVLATSHFEREYRKLAAKHHDLPEHYAGVLVTLETDPYNHSRGYAIKKLEGVDPGDAQWRIRSGRYRFR